MFFDYDRIELCDEAHSGDEDRKIDDILFVVYTERAIIDEDGKSREVTRLISARLATSFERGVYYGKRS